MVAYFCLILTILDQKPGKNILRYAREAPIYFIVYILGFRVAGKYTDLLP